MKRLILLTMAITSFTTSGFSQQRENNSAAIPLLSTAYNNQTDKNMREKTEPVLGLGEAITEHFTGEAWLHMLSSQSETYDCTIYNVTFAPSTRNYWHTHSEGQILICTEGKGYYQQKGEAAKPLESGAVVHIPSGVVHWHGATPNNQFTHIGITPKATQNRVEWGGEVTDEEYSRAVDGVAQF